MSVLSSIPRVRLLAVTLAVLLGGACSDATLPLPHEGVPEALSFSVSGYGSSSNSIELRGDTIVFRRADWSWSPGDAEQIVRTVPTEAQWRAFWAAADRAGVGDWQRRYLAEGIVDGSGWTLRLTINGQELVSEGSNAYPDREGREHEGESTSAFREFQGTLMMLAGQPVAVSPPPAGSGE
jgi:hypothetical protein